MEEIYIHHHLGLGDHIICNGLIRSLSKKININLFVKKINSLNVSYMFRDLFNVNIIIIENDNDVYLKYNNKKILRIGFENLTRLMETYSIGWDECFYKQLEIPFNLRWDEFYFLSDEERENKLYEKLNNENHKFCLIHSTGSDGVNRVDYDIVDKDLHIIEIKKEYTNNIFDYCKLIKLATEIHCIDSSFLHLVDSLETFGKLFYHNLKYTRNQNETHKQIKNWILV